MTRLPPATFRHLLFFALVILLLSIAGDIRPSKEWLVGRIPILASSQIAVTNPVDSAGYYLRGRLWLREKEYNRAIEDFDEAIRLAPTVVITAQASVLGSLG